jgi:hypothetical protein
MGLEEYEKLPSRDVRFEAGGGYDSGELFLVIEKVGLDTLRVISRASNRPNGIFTRFRCLEMSLERVVVGHSEVDVTFEFGKIRCPLPSHRLTAPKLSSTYRLWRPQEPSESALTNQGENLGSRELETGEDGSLREHECGLMRAQPDMDAHEKCPCSSCGQIFLCPSAHENHKYTTGHQVLYELLESRKAAELAVVAEAEALVAKEDRDSVAEAARSEHEELKRVAFTNILARGRRRSGWLMQEEVADPQAWPRRRWCRRGRASSPRRS